MRLLLGGIWRGMPCLLLIMAALGTRPAEAQIGSARYASFVMDAGSGQILSAVNADEPRYPASLTKMMTIYMLFEAVRDRRVTLDQAVPVSTHAASMPPSKLGLLPGTYITVEQALLGLVTKSANDAAAALGELLGGDEDRFAQMMTLRARALGMSRTTFRNASGWPDPDQITTARDLALLARHLIQDYPVEYRYFSVPSFVFHGRLIPNHDHMLQTYPGADGLKTGYIDASGCNLVTSAVRGDVRLIGVVMGASTGSERDIHMASLLDSGFDRMGVPISRAPVQRPQMPALLAAASAATLPQSTLTARGWGGRHGGWQRPSRPAATAAVADPRQAARLADHHVAAHPDYRQEVHVAPAVAHARPRPEAPAMHSLVHPSVYGRSAASTGGQAHIHG